MLPVREMFHRQTSCHHLNKKVQLVVTTLDMDPTNLVVFLPALCQKMGVLYYIIQGKASWDT